MLSRLSSGTLSVLALLALFEAPVRAYDLQYDASEHTERYSALSLQRARAILEQAFQKNSCVAYRDSNSIGSIVPESFHISAYGMDARSLDSAEPIHWSFDDWAGAQVWVDHHSMRPDDVLIFGLRSGEEGKVRPAALCAATTGDLHDEPRLIADAILRLLTEYRYLPAIDELSFREGLARHRADASGADLPEEARRFMVQAEAAVKDEHLDEASDLYARALAAAPWWSAGHYNRAVVLGETKRYPEAIAEMARYLVLKPAAPDARAAQDRIYLWERSTVSEGKPGCLSCYARYAYAAGRQEDFARWRQIIANEGSADDCLRMGSDLLFGNYSFDSRYAEAAALLAKAEAAGLKNADRLKRFAQRLSQQKFPKGRIGIAMAPDSTDTGSGGAGSGVKVQAVQPGSPAEKAGIKAGDIIVQAEGTPTQDRLAFLEIVSTTEPGARLTLKVIRDGVAQEIRNLEPAH